MPRPIRPGSRRLLPDQRSWFDRFADELTRFVAHPLFFLGCVVSVLVWGAAGPPAQYSSDWQLVINTGTTIVTFLMVALLQNSQRRHELSVHRKLDAIADAMADFMDKADLDLEQDVRELEEAVWLEKVQPSREARAGARRGSGRPYLEGRARRRRLGKQ